MIHKRSKLTLLAILMLTTAVVSCKKEPYKLRQTYEQQFHGKYSIVSATSDQEVDINLDGVKGSNTLLEIPELKASYLELIARGETNATVFAQFWQNQYFIGVEGRPLNYTPGIIVQFLNQPTVAGFSIDQETKSLVLSRSAEDLSFPLPTSVKIVDKEKIMIIFSKEIFTPIGWKTIKFTVVYKRSSSDV